MDSQFKYCKHFCFECKQNDHKILREKVLMQNNELDYRWNLSHYAPVYKSNWVYMEWMHGVILRILNLWMYWWLTIWCGINTGNIRFYSYNSLVENPKLCWQFQQSKNPGDVIHGFGKLADFQGIICFYNLKKILFFGMVLIFIIHLSAIYSPLLITLSA